MAEISKQYKIILIINIFVSTVYAVPFMFMIKRWAEIIGYTTSTPWFAQFFGLALFLMAAWLLRAILQKKQFEDITFFIEFCLAIMFGMIIYFVLELIFVSETPITRIYGIVGTAITAALLITNMVFYFIETAKHP